MDILLDLHFKRSSGFGGC